MSRLVICKKSSCTPVERLDVFNPMRADVRKLGMLSIASTHLQNPNLKLTTLTFFTHTTNTTEFDAVKVYTLSTELLLISSPAY